MYAVLEALLQQGMGVFKRHDGYWRGGGRCWVGERPGEAAQATSAARRSPPTRPPSFKCSEPSWGRLSWQTRGLQLSGTNAWRACTPVVDCSTVTAQHRCCIIPSVQSAIRAQSFLAQSFHAVSLCLVLVCRDKVWRSWGLWSPTSLYLSVPTLEQRVFLLWS